VAHLQVVKSIDQILGVEVDVCINNDRPLYNTRLLRTYCDVDPRFQTLALVVKTWVCIS
jgi:DNA polymerase sigma